MSTSSYELEVSATDRVGYLGKTGKGKTFLAKRFINQFEGVRIVIVDTKRTIKLPGYKVVADEDKAIKTGKCIYRPKGTTKPSDRFYRKLWARYGAKRKPNLCLYVDEMAHVTGPHSIDDHLKLMIQAGREVGVGVHWAGQQSTGVNNWALSQTEKLFVFELPVEGDRKKLAAVVGDAVEDAAHLPVGHFMAFGFPEVEGIQTSEGTETYILMLDGSKDLGEETGGRARTGKGFGRRRKDTGLQVQAVHDKQRRTG